MVSQARIIAYLLADDTPTFVRHKTLAAERMTCAGAVGVMSKLGRLPVIARLGLAVGIITERDIDVRSS
jgi:CBS domain-containing protein